MVTIQDQRLKITLLLAQYLKLKKCIRHQMQMQVVIDALLSIEDLHDVRGQRKKTELRNHLLSSVCLLSLKPQTLTHCPLMMSQANCTLQQHQSYKSIALSHCTR